MSRTRQVPFQSAPAPLTSLDDGIGYRVVFWRRRKTGAPFQPAYYPTAPSSRDGVVYTRGEALATLRLLTAPWVDSGTRPARECEPAAVEADVPFGSLPHRFTLWDVEPWDLLADAVRGVDPDNADEGWVTDDELQPARRAA